MRRPNIGAALLARLRSSPRGLRQRQQQRRDHHAAGGATTTAPPAAEAAVTSRSTPCRFTPVAADTLTVVTSLPGPGFWNGTDPNKIKAGYEYEMAKALQAKLGLKSLKVRNENFDTIVDRRGEGLRHRPLAGDDHRRARARSSTSRSRTSRASRASSPGPART